MQDIPALVLLVAVVVTSAVMIHTFVSGTLADLFSSPKTTFQLTLPLRIEKIYYQDANTCFILRNPNNEEIDINKVSIYINGRLYNPSSDSNTIPPDGTCTLCVPYIPSGDEEVRISTGAGASAQTTIPEEITPIKLYCNSCSDCTSKLQTALSWAEANDTTAVVYLTQDISASGTCISLSDLNFNGLVTFDGQGHIITGPGSGTGIYISNTSDLTVKNITLTNFDFGINLVFSSSNTLSSITASNNGDGIRLYYSSSNTLTNITASNNYTGVILDTSSSNTLSNITANDNNYYGIDLVFSSSNTLFSITANDNDTHGIYFYTSSSTLSLLDSNSYACGNTTNDIYLSSSTLTCTNCGNGYYFHYNTVTGTGLTCDCNASCP